MQLDQTTLIRICSRYIQQGTTLPTVTSPTWGVLLGVNPLRVAKNLNLVNPKTTWTVHSSNSRWASYMQVSHRMSFLLTMTILCRIATTWCHRRPVRARDVATSLSTTQTASSKYPIGLRTSHNSLYSSRLPLLHRLLTTISWSNSHLRIQAVVRR